MASNPSTNPGETTQSNNQYMQKIEEGSLMGMKPFEYSFCQNKDSKREQKFLQFMNPKQQETLMVQQLNNAIQIRINKSRSSNQSQSGQKSPFFLDNISHRSFQASNRSRSPIHNTTESDDDPIFTVQQIQKLCEDLELERRQKWKAQQKLKIQMQENKNLKLDLQISLIEIEALKGQIDLLIEEKMLLEHRLSSEDYSDSSYQPRTQHLSLISRSVDLNIEFPVFKKEFVFDKQHSEIINFSMNQLKTKICQQEVVESNNQINSRASQMNSYKDMAESREDKGLDVPLQPVESNKRGDCRSDQGMVQPRQDEGFDVPFQPDPNKSDDCISVQDMVESREDGGIDVPFQPIDTNKSDDCIFVQDIAEPREDGVDVPFEPADPNKSDDCISVEYMIESQRQSLTEHKKVIQVPKAWKSQQTRKQPVRNTNLLNLFLNKNKICVFD